MGQLIDGVWSDQWYDTKSTGGSFKRSASQFRNWITPDGQPGPSGAGGFAAESGRYHLFVSYACPWAHRTLIFRALKGLSPHIDVSVVHPDMLDKGWTYAADFPGATGDTLMGNDYHYQVYLAADPKYTGRVTVPVLWDRERRTIVNNESADILRMLNSGFGDLADQNTDLYPSELRDEIETGLVERPVISEEVAIFEARMRDRYRVQRPPRTP